jgi:hypothetical protein
VVDLFVFPLYNAPESECSPAVTPDGGPIFRVRVEVEGTQRLWRLNDGKQPELVLADVKAVGYYARTYLAYGRSVGPRRRVDLDALEGTDVTRIAVS